MVAPAEGLSPWRRRTRLAALLCLLAGIAALAAPSRSEAGCSAEANFCVNGKTDPAGTYTLFLTPKMIEFAAPELTDCIWNVDVDFGDGQSESYVFDASVGLTASHTFPSHGTYDVEIRAREGHHGETTDPCPDVAIDATITYPQPPEPKEPPGEEPPGEEPPGEEPPPGEKTLTGGSQQPGPGPGDDQMSESAGGPAPGYWRSCGAGILTHRVLCRRARGVLREARLTLAKGLETPVHVSGFTCHLRPRAKRQIACRRGGRRILAPLRSPRG